MYKKSLTSEVSVSEMQQMRSEGMNNQQIADRLGCCVRTVIRYIGKQPAMLRAAYGSQSAKTTGIIESEKPTTTVLPTKKSGLHIIAQTKIMEGKYHQFTINSFGNISIVSKCQDQKLQLNQKGMEELIMELMDAYSELSECCAVKN